MLAKLKDEISKLGKYGIQTRPHKLIALLVAFDELIQQDCSDSKVRFSESFQKKFKSIFNEHFKDSQYSCRPHNPFFHLQSASFWKLVPKEGKEQVLTGLTTVGGPGEIIELVEYAEISADVMVLLKDKQHRKEVLDFVNLCLEGIKSNNSENPISDNGTNCSKTNKAPKNNLFVNYLNSLQRSSGSNENALAESQACNEQFATIHVSHPLSEKILHELTSPDGHHVMLTGHAGDGKSTIALEVFKSLTTCPVDEPLKSPMQPREEIGDIVIIKDLSERDIREDEALINQLLQREKRFLIITNTGTLLDLVKRHSQLIHIDELTLESNVLNAISTETGEGVLEIGAASCRVYNLARMDNLFLIRQIFLKMLAPERWEECKNRPCESHCPVLFNIRLIQNYQKRIIDRIFLAYRRMHEYGIRLTVRQYTEHLAYLLTSGLEYADIQSLIKQSSQPLILGTMFFNRFFGDDGCFPDPSASQMEAVKAILSQGFGERPNSFWEHRLWLRSRVKEIALGVDKCDALFKQFQQLGAQNKNYGNLSSEKVREQARRMLYFLYDFRDDENNFLGQYLNSPSLLKWQGWQEDESHFSYAEKGFFDKKIYHVLQEHLTGVRLPEGSSQNERRLYVTLSRRRNEVRQSAQVVLAEVDWRTSIELRLKSSTCSSGHVRKDLILVGKAAIKGIDLPLKVPFLDYVMMRHFGELGEILQSSYLEHLDRFKAQIQKIVGGEDDKRIMLVRLKTDHTFRRQAYKISEGVLEVDNVY